jgi:CRISPR-associated endonuclease/helicase Cas3
MPCSFDDFFERAAGHPPYPYQRELATRSDFPERLDIATGLGKTLAVLLAWLWRRRFVDHKTKNLTPRRLAYCLPMRVLVEQTVGVICRCLMRVGLLAGKASWSAVDSEGLPTPNAVLVEYIPDPSDERTLTGCTAEFCGPGTHRIATHLLMGGEELTDWALWPERDAILIGTQDMLLSRMLNRGYAASRARWPVEFGLLNNDCLWVLDEVQLMGSGLITTAQLDAFRYGGKQSLGVGCYGQCRFLWMSATIQPEWLETVDHPLPTSPPLGLSAEEKQDRQSEAGRRLHATKLLKQASVFSDDKPSALAREILASHQTANAEETEPVLTLVVVNTVDRAVALHRELVRLTARQEQMEEPLLIHSRFRPPDRQRQVERLFSPCPPGGRIVVSTQVIEAGVDISAKVLFTELSPWASLVQRFGRCNRKGEYQAAAVFWIDLGDKHSPPYEQEDLMVARQVLQDVDLHEVGPIALENCLAAQPVEIKQRLFAQHPGQVIRRKDLLELFDTTPDLAGNDLDISRYIRDTDDHDVQVFWREIPPDGMPDDVDAKPGRREELCSVPAKDFRRFLENNDRVWRWDFLDSRWVLARAGQVFAGQTFLIACDAGGYSPAVGWHGKKETVAEVPRTRANKAEAADGTDRDVPSVSATWQSIAVHTEEVSHQLDAILEGLTKDLPAEVLRLAVRWHDRGKAHAAFLAKLNPEAQQCPEAREVLFQDGGIAKAPDACWRGRLGPFARWDLADGRRRHFRHELASALAVLQASAELVPQNLRDLVAYLVAAHHGKVRLSIRSLPDEFRPTSSAVRFARGVWGGDLLPTTALGGAVLAPQVNLSLEPMELGFNDDGEPSWAEQMLILRDDPQLGPFRLAYLEAVLRAADRRASAKAQTQMELAHA